MTELRLEGDDNDDLFVIRAFAIAAVVDTDANDDGFLNAADITDPFGIDTDADGIADIPQDPDKPLIGTRLDITGDGIANAAPWAGRFR